MLGGIPTVDFADASGMWMSSALFQERFTVKWAIAAVLLGAAILISG